MINILVKIGLSQDNFRMLFCSETIQNFFANNARVHITLFTNLLQIFNQRNRYVSIMVNVAV